jgi:nonsense-mediated mRNA decay protein 3
MTKFYQEHQDNSKVININSVVNNTMSILNRSSMMTYSKIVCCVCSAAIEANERGMCNTCARTEINITDGISKNGLLHYCKGCDRYMRPPWVRCGSSLESPEMMAFCLSKIKGLTKVKLVDSSFVWTEPHSKMIKIKLTVQKEMNKTLVETSLVVEFKVEWTQCDDCKKTFTPHIWNASCQIRQKVNHKRTFMLIEQIVLKNKAHTKALNVKEHPEGVDFYFAHKSQALSFADFIKTALPAKVKQSKQLVSLDDHSNTINYKYSFMIELAPVCKDDLIVLDKETSKSLGGAGPVLLCYKFNAQMHLIDPLTFNTYHFDGSTYWRHGFKSYVDRRCLEEFLIINVEEEIDYSKKYAHANTVSDVEMASEVELNSRSNQSKSTNFKNLNKSLNNSTGGRGSSGKNKNIVNVQCISNTKSGENGEATLITIRSHLGRKIRPGDVYYGYNLNTLNLTEELSGITNYADSIPDIVLVKKKYVRSENAQKRYWKLKHLQKDVEMGAKRKNPEAEEAQYEEFLRDIEEDKDLRKVVNLYKDDEVLKELEGKFKNLKVTNEETDSDIDIKVDELLEDLNLNDKEEENDKNNDILNVKEGIECLENEEIVDTFEKPNPYNKGKKQIGKRDRKGNNIDESF